jgi:hypothetical protein
MSTTAGGGLRGGHPEAVVRGRRRQLRARDGGHVAGRVDGARRLEPFSAARRQIRILAAMARSRSTRAPRNAHGQAREGRTNGQVAQPAARRTVSWLHCLIGLIAGEALLLLLSNAGLSIANAAFGASGSHQADGGIVGVSSLIAVMAGGYLAARLAGHHGLYQGIVVACGFIAWGAVFQFLNEAGTVASSLSAGGHTLVDLGPMDMGSVVSGDLLALFGGTVGGLLSGKR